MPYGVASAKQLAMMTSVLESFCSTHEVTDPVKRDDTAAVILELFNLGFRDKDALLQELQKRRFGRSQSS